MPIDAEHSKEIREAYSTLQDEEGLLELLNRVNTLWAEQHGIKTTPITKGQLKAFGDHRNEERFYTSFSIPKKDGSKREITAPVRSLKKIQRCLNWTFQTIHEPHPAAKGFLPGESIVSNAEPHVGKNYVLNMDIADFFPSIKFRRVQKVLQLNPYPLPEPLAFKVANLCAYQGALPQGAPTSPILSNMVCKRLDQKMHRLTRSHNATYTRYGDDMSFSAYKAVFKEGFVEKVKKALQEEGFAAKDSKTREQERVYRQEVTGLTVNEKVNVPRSYIRILRAMLNNWEKKGLEEATRRFFQAHSKRSLSEDDKRLFFNTIRGKLEHLKKVKGKNSKSFKKYKNYYENLKVNWLTKNLKIEVIKTY